ncbi:MAG: asparagine synthase-related protein [Sphingomonas sp.]|uniref:asparagine synthase-related protein n=1 Tax=Sphingomonas sp. TaxID=28214 RepID=UPI00356312DD
MIPLSYVALLKRQTVRHSERLDAFVTTLSDAHGLSVLHQSSTLLVLGDPQLPRVVLAGEAGLLIGYAFDRASNARLTAPFPAQGEPADSLIDRIWGGYVTLRTRDATPEVMREPSGTVPCYHMEIEGIHVVTSRPDLLRATGLLEPEIDWTILTQGLVYRDLKPARTPLRGVSEILPGVAARLFPTGLDISCAWSPWTHVARCDPRMTMAQACQIVADRLDECLAAWGSCAARAVTEISGGLDSAIVAAGLARSPASIVGLTYAATTGDPDETPYARAIATHCGLSLQVEHPSIDGIDIALSDAALLARPYARIFARPFDRAAQRVAHDHAAAMFFGGGGGDNVFSYQRTLSPAIDRIRATGMGRGVWETMGDLATLGETSIWHIAARVARRVRRPTAPIWKPQTGFLDAQAIADLPAPHGHPWAAVPPNQLPGKIAHVAALMRAQNHVEGHARQCVAPMICPLLSQPLMEACLAIPSWLWCSGGRNRAVARAAYADRLPASVIARQSKGTFDSFSARLFAANRDRMRTLLLDGALAEHLPLDRTAIEAGLATPLPDGEAIVRLWSLVDAETWARSWVLKGAMLPLPSG